MSKPEATVLFDALGPQGRRRARLASIIAVVVLLIPVVYGLSVLASKDFFAAANWATVFDKLLIESFWIPGLLGTLKAAMYGSIGAVVLGAIIGLGRVSRFATFRAITAVYVQFFRAMPLLLLIWIPYTLNLFFHFANPLFGGTAGPDGGGGDPLAISTFFVALGLAVYNAAILAEILRSGINALPSGQAMAGQAVGLRHGQVMRSVVLPQAVRNMLPAVLAQLVILLKDTSLGYVVAYPELLHEAQLVGKAYEDIYLQALVTVALIYFVVAYSLSKLVHVVDRRMQRKTAAKTTVRADAEQAAAV